MLPKRVRTRCGPLAILFLAFLLLLAFPRWLCLCTLCAASIPCVHVKSSRRHDTTTAHHHYLSLHSSLEQLLKSYSTSIGLEEYAAVQKKVDEVSRRSFHIDNLKSDSPPSTAAASATTAAASSKQPEQPGDPLEMQKTAWKAAGVTGHVFGVPAEYQGMADITGGSKTAVSKVPDYVSRANLDLRDGDGDGSLDDTPPSASGSNVEAASAREPRRSEDATVKEAKAPLMSAPKGESVDQLIAKAVGSALTSANEPEPAASSGRISNLYQVSNSASSSMGSAAPTQQLETDARAQSELTRSVEDHYSDEIDAIYGDNDESTSSRRSVVRHVKAVLVKESSYVRKMAEKFERLRREKGRRRHVVATMRDAHSRSKRLVAEQVEHIKRRQEGLAAVGAERKGVDGAVKDAEQKEISELKKEVKSMQEKEKLQSLKLQVAKLKRRVEQKEAASDGWGSKKKVWGRGERGVGHWGGIKGGVGLGTRMVDMGEREVMEGKKREKEEKEKEIEEGEKEKEEGKEVMAEAEAEIKKGESKESKAEEEEEDKEDNKGEEQSIKICDGMGCHSESVAPPPPAPKPVSAKQYIKVRLPPLVFLFVFVIVIVIVIVCL